MRNHLKIVPLLLVSLAIVITLADCILPGSNTQQEGKSDIPKPDNKGTAQTSTQPQSEPDTYVDSSKSQYFFINGSPLGSYVGDGWSSLCDTGNYETSVKGWKTFYAKDILNQE